MSEFWDAASAVATTAATGVALWLAVHEVQMRRKDETDRQAAQARLVVSAIEGTRGEVVNHSSEPLLELRIIRADADVDGRPVAVRWAEDAQRIFRNVSAGEERHLELRVQGWGPLIHPELSYEVGTDEGVAPFNASNHRLTIQFLDAAGLWWQRVGLEPPTRVLGEPAQPAANPE
ncbi:hypothetical protein C0216_30655 (plasmid) [Streptomyces globosus]|uniref:Uncharacterized protein n=1 Tax=Streptomyces globosus TaxID=68209 RepID=A0A344UAG0_9ACTN|nr:hypothetical protein [Streptomyces globosus]AXE27881.1 hypothetical protein C0216_30655 [Streptomyces globosus]